MSSSPRLDLTKDMVLFVAEMRNRDLPWTAIGSEFGVSGPRIKAAYLRGSQKHFGKAA